MILLAIHYKMPWDYKTILAVLDRKYPQAARESLFFVQEIWQEFENLELSSQEMELFTGDSLLDTSLGLDERYYSEGFLSYIQTEKPIRRLMEKHNLLAGNEKGTLINTMKSIEDFLLKSDPETEIIVVTLWKDMEFPFL